MAFEPESSLVSSEATVGGVAPPPTVSPYEVESSLISSEATVEEAVAPAPPAPAPKRRIPWWIWLLLLGAGTYIAERLRRRRR